MPREALASGSGGIDQTACHCLEALPKEVLPLPRGLEALPCLEAANRLACEAWSGLAQRLEGPRLEARGALEALPTRSGSHV